MVQISETVLVNEICWISSLPESEQGPTRRITQDLEDRSELTFLLKSVTNRCEMVAALAALAERAGSEGARPILHVDAHATQSKGILLAPSGERLAWDEFVDLIRTINVNTGNNLICVLGLCFGLQAIWEIRLGKATPAFIMIAPREEVSNGFLEDETLKFYTSLDQSGDVIKAYEATLKKRMKMVHCQDVLFQALVKYISAHCRGRNKQARKEYMTTLALEHYGIRNPSSEQLRMIRKEMKIRLEPGQHTIDHFAPGFLIGRKAQFTYDDLSEHVNSS